MGTKESNNDYTAESPINKETGKRESSAVGKYQHLWNIHAPEIERITGVTSIEEYKKNPAAQEKYQKHLENIYVSNVNDLRTKHKVSDKVPDETLMMLQHFLGLGDANVYLDALRRTQSYEAAQEAVEESIRKRTGKNPPKNSLIVDYIEDFQNRLNALPNEKANTRTEPIVKVNQEPKLNTKPTFTASPFAKPVTKAETKPVVNKPATPVTSTKAAASPANTKFKEPRPDFTLPSVEVNWKQSASAVKWIYEAFGGSDEDKINVLSYLENGGSLSDVWDIYENYKAKKGGSENTDLIGESKSITSTTSDADKAIVNWGAPTLNISRESKAKSNYIIPKLKVADSPSVNKDEYTSKSFVANLKNKDNKFKVLNNIHANSGVGNIDNFYKNFQPVNGSIVFTMQNDVVSGQKPLTTITKDDKWYEGSQYLIKLTDDNNMEVVKTSSVKEGDQVFKLKNKVFSFEDFDIKDGKIKTVFDSNIGALIPVVKGDAKTYKSGSNFVIGLTDTNKTPGYIPIESASQYGKSRGGSFIVFNDDLTQQYMVGGSFKNLYDFYQDLKKQYPNSNFKVFSSDTGSYSNSFFPKSGQIDGDVYRKSNNRNTWGEVQHIVLMN